MTSENQNTSRTVHLLALMKKGDGAFNARDFVMLDQIHHPDMIAFITGSAQPIYGLDSAHCGDSANVALASRTCTCTTRIRTRSNLDAAIGSPW